MNKKNNISPIIIFLTLLIPLFFYSTVRIASLEGCENCFDVYYHVGIADLGPSYFCADKLPAMSMSLWAEKFSDKELGFHFILSALRTLRNFIFLESNPPFHFSILFFAIALCSFFTFLIFKFKIRHPLIISTLFFSLSPFFTSRMLMLRPQILSVTLMLLAVILFLQIEKISHLWTAGLIGFLFSWTYSNPHFVLLPAFVFGFTIFLKKDRKTGILLPLAAVLGLALGFIIHPQFPANIINWKIQCVDVVMKSIGMGPENAVLIGNELSPPPQRYFLYNFAVYIVFIFNVFAVIKLQKKEKNLSFEIISLFILAFICITGTFLAQRTMEYAWPFNLLCFGLLLNKKDVIFSFNFSKIGRCIIKYGLLINLLLIYSFAWYFKYMNMSKIEPAWGFAEWAARKKIPPGTKIANPNWSDFPLLFYVAPQYRYTFGIDPMFAYYRFPEKINKLELFRQGKQRLSQKKLREVIGTRLFYVSAYALDLAKDLENRGFKMLYGNNDGWVFLLEPENEK